MASVLTTLVPVLIITFFNFLPLKCKVLLPPSSATSLYATRIKITKELSTMCPLPLKEQPLKVS
jgi:hypothetical protein